MTKIDIPAYVLGMIDACREEGETPARVLLSPAMYKQLLSDTLAEMKPEDIPNPRDGALVVIEIHSLPIEIAENPPHGDIWLDSKPKSNEG